MNEISAIIVVKDNPPHLFKTIQSIDSLVKQIVIADIGINPLTLSKLKENKKLKVVRIKKDVQYVELIREELKQHASCEYILYIDPDEVFPESLIQHLSSSYYKYAYIKIPRRNIIFGKWIEHGRWWPDYQVRLFKKTMVTWPKLLHTQPQVSGNGYTIEPKKEYAIIHHNYESVDEFIEKATRYAKSEANEISSFSLGEALKKALSEFTSRYFSDEGYKDGMHGFVLSFLQMFYYFLVYVYYWEKTRFVQTDTSIIHDVHHFFKQGMLESNYWIIKKRLDSSFGTIKRKLHMELTKLLSS